MKYFYIDTTSSFLYAAIVSDNELVIEIKKELGHNMSEQGFIEIENMFKKASVRLEEINKIILVNGPGSFTGTRIGVTIAKTLAWTLGLRISTISSLLAMAISFDSEGFKVPIIDARRSYVFGAIFDSNNNPVLKEQYLKLDVLQMACTNLGEDVSYISNNEFGLKGLRPYNPNISKIIEFAKDFEDENVHGIDANYLKLTEAEENKIDS